MAQGSLYLRATNTRQDRHRDPNLPAVCLTRLNTSAALAAARGHCTGGRRRVRGLEQAVDVLVRGRAVEAGEEEDGDGGEGEPVALQGLHRNLEAEVVRLAGRVGVDDVEVLARGEVVDAQQHLEREVVGGVARRAVEAQRGGARERRQQQHEERGAAQQRADDDEDPEGRGHQVVPAARLAREQPELHERVLAAEVEAVGLEQVAERALHPPREHGRREGGAHQHELQHHQHHVQRALARPRARQPPPPLGLRGPGLGLGRGGGGERGGERGGGGLHRHGLTVVRAVGVGVGVGVKVEHRLLQPVGGVVALSGAVVQVFDEDRGGEGEHDGDAEEVPGQGDAEGVHCVEPLEAQVHLDARARQLIRRGQRAVERRGQPAAPRAAVARGGGRGERGGRGGGGARGYGGPRLRLRLVHRGPRRGGVTPCGGERGGVVGRRQLGAGCGARAVEGGLELPPDLGQVETSGEHVGQRPLAEEGKPVVAVAAEGGPEGQVEEEVEQEELDVRPACVHRGVRACVRAGLGPGGG
eukprot:scaffold74926_cov63-Phaeocystis_antarctica.AAC.3